MAATSKGLTDRQKRDIFVDRAYTICEKKAENRHSDPAAVGEKSFLDFSFQSGGILRFAHQNDNERAIKGNVIGGAVYSRRDFLSSLSGAYAGIFFVGSSVADSAFGAAQSLGTGKRREVTIGGQRVLTVDVHTHVLVPEALDLVKGYKETASIRDQFASVRGPGYDLHIVDTRLEHEQRRN